MNRPLGIKTVISIKDYYSTKFYYYVIIPYSLYITKGYISSQLVNAYFHCYDCSHKEISHDLFDY